MRLAGIDDFPRLDKFVRSQFLQHKPYAEIRIARSTQQLPDSYIRFSIHNGLSVVVGCNSDKRVAFAAHQLKTLNGELIP